MDVNTIRDLVYDSTGTTSNQIPTTSILSWMNIAYHDIVETIKHEVDPDFFYRFFTTNIVAGQNEYALRL